MQNLKAYDETHDITDPEDIATPRPHSQAKLSSLNLPSNMRLSDNESTTDVDSNRPAFKLGKDKDKDENSDSSEEDEDEEEENVPVVAGAYNPSDYDNLVVTQEIKELFQYIQRYTPQTIELESRLRPFIPEYIPSVGDIDAFIKVPRPDLKPDDLGLRVLDEPCAKQSDPIVLDLQLRALSKQTTATQAVIRSIENAEKDPKKIQNWIKSISDLHRAKPPPSVHYNKNMPDVESLMQAWPPEMEQLLRTISLPSADLDCNLSLYVDLICGILDIPIYPNKIQSLHLLFTVYNEFKNSQHFSDTLS